MSKNEWRYTSTPQYAFMAWCLVKAQRKLDTKSISCILLKRLHGVVEIFINVIRARWAEQVAFMGNMRNTFDGR
jgi:hypothetical protein